MSFSLLYLTSRVFYRIFSFLKHWYVGAFFIISHQTLSFLEYLDRFWALRITLRNFFKPLYQDRSIIGYTLGLFFRTLRVIGGSIVYLLAIAIGAAIYILWALLPIFIIFSARQS